jgi:hypothetical protein
VKIGCGGVAAIGDKLLGGIIRQRLGGVMSAYQPDEYDFSAEKLRHSMGIKRRKSVA